MRSFILLRHQPEMLEGGHLWMVRSGWVLELEEPGGPALGITPPGVVVNPLGERETGVWIKPTTARATLSTISAPISPAHAAFKLNTRGALLALRSLPGPQRIEKLLLYLRLLTDDNVVPVRSYEISLLTGYSRFRTHRVLAALKRRGALTQRGSGMEVRL